MNGVTIAVTITQVIFGEFANDGMWGHIYFIVPENTYEPVSNNGAHACLGIPKKYKELIGQYSDKGWQLVHMATPCMGTIYIDRKNSIGRVGDCDNLEGCGLGLILENAAKDIDLMIPRNKEEALRVKGLERINLALEDLNKKNKDYIFFIGDFGVKKKNRI